jgi:PAS domain-containing protein
MKRSDRLMARLMTLRAVSRALARPLEGADVLRAVYAELEHAFDVTICFFGRYDAPGQVVEVIWQMHEGVELSGGHFPLGDGPTSQVIRNCHAQLIRHWSDEGPRVQLQYATERPGLPESALTVPVVFDEKVMGVLALQSYQPEAYDEDDLALLQGVADQVAVAIARSRHATRRAAEAEGRALEVESIFASLPDAMLVVDDQGRLVRVNHAARKLLCLTDGSLILGQPVHEPQAGLWPLGTQTLTQQLVPILDQLRQGAAPDDEIPVALEHRPDHTVGCKASVLLKGGAPAGGLLVLREKAA